MKSFSFENSINMNDFLAMAESSLILCCYTNLSPQIQIIRVVNIPSLHIERVAFPGERLLFEAPSDAQLEVHTGALMSAILSDTIPCQALEVKQPDPIEAIV